MIETATRVRCRRPTDEAILYQTSNRADLDALAAALQTTPGHGEYCMCLGTLLFDFDGAQTITLHHGESLRWEGSNGNHPLVSPDAIMDWLSAHGITFVREEYEDARRRADESQAEAERWKAAMPSSLLPFFDDMRQSGGNSRPEWTAAIEAELPDPLVRARVLLELYGSGVGLWSGYPSWESVPAQWLIAMPRDLLLKAIGDAPSDRMCEGALRLLCSWDYRKQRKKLRDKMPAALRERLLAYAAKMSDDNCDEAIRRLTE